MRQTGADQIDTFVENLSVPTSGHEIADARAAYDAPRRDRRMRGVRGSGERRGAHPYREVTDARVAVAAGPLDVAGQLDPGEAIE